MTHQPDRDPVPCSFYCEPDNGIHVFVSRWNVPIIPPDHLAPYVRTVAVQTWSGVPRSTCLPPGTEYVIDHQEPAREYPQKLCSSEMPYPILIRVRIVR